MLRSTKLAKKLRKKLKRQHPNIREVTKKVTQKLDDWKAAQQSDTHRKCRHWRIRVDWIQQLVDLQIVKFHKIASAINNISDVTTKVVPSFTWEGLSRLMIGASPKFIPGTQINVRYAQQLARDERTRNKDTDLVGDSYAAKLTRGAADECSTSIVSCVFIRSVPCFEIYYSDL